MTYLDRYRKLYWELRLDRPLLAEEEARRSVILDDCWSHLDDTEKDLIEAELRSTPFAPNSLDSVDVAVPLGGTTVPRVKSS